MEVQNYIYPLNQVYEVELQMLSSEQNPERSVATEADSSTKAGNQIFIHFLYICNMTIEKLNDMRSRIAGVRRFL